MIKLKKLFLIDFSFGRPGTLSAQISHFVLITASIVVADIKEDRNAAKDHGSFSAIIFLNNYLAANSDIQTDILTDKLHFV